jgi:hypothetical protein
MKYYCVKQHDITDCGAACLATISKQYGLNLSISKIREVAGTDKQGTNAYGMIKAAEQLGFSAKGVKGNQEAFFTEFPLPAIAHVVADGSLLHYVVIHKITKKQIIIADPGKGIVKYTPEEFFKTLRKKVCKNPVDCGIIKYTGGWFYMGRRKREPMSEGKKNIIGMLLEEYDIKTAKDIEDALKDLLGGTIQEMLESEMDEHLGYSAYERSDNTDYRNGKKTKKIRGNFGETEIEVPQDRDGTFEPKLVKKRQKDISGIEQKIISLYAKGMTTRQISETIEDIYGFEVSDGLVSDITDRLLPQIEDWQKRPLDEVYPIVFIDAVHFLYEKMDR